MLGHLGISIKINAEKGAVLTQLRKNLEQHKKLVADARAGYIAKATAELERKLGQLKENKPVALTFSLKPPKDYSSAYETVIRTLEMHTGDTVELTSAEVCYFIEDNWDWMTDFVGSNRLYSTSTREYGMSKGLEID